MEMTGFVPLLLWALVGATVLGGGFYLYVEYQTYLLRTSVSSVPGGLRFVAQGLTVESRHSKKELKITAKNGRYVRQLLAGGDEEVQVGPLEVTIAAIGLQIEVSRVAVKDPEGGPAKATGFSRIVFLATDQPLQTAMGHTGGYRSELHLDRVPDAIATQFQKNVKERKERSLFAIRWWNEVRWECLDLTDGRTSGSGIEDSTRAVYTRSKGSKGSKSAREFDKFD